MEDEVAAVSQIDHESGGSGGGGGTTHGTTGKNWDRENACLCSSRPLALDDMCDARCGTLIDKKGFYLTYMYVARD